MVAESESKMQTSAWVALVGIQGVVVVNDPRQGDLGVAMQNTCHAGFTQHVSRVSALRHPTVRRKPRTQRHSATHLAHCKVSFSGGSTHGVTGPRPIRMPASSLELSGKCSPHLRGGDLVEA